MMGVGIVLTFLGYGVGSYGYVLVKGWDITLRQWFSPIHPWTWPSGQVPTVPPGQIMPGTVTGSANSPSNAAPPVPFPGFGGPQNTPTGSASLPEGGVAGQHGR